MPGYPDRVLACGGDDNGAALSSCQLIDFGHPTPTWRSTGSMNHARTHHNLVILPNRQVLAIGGGETELFIDPVLIAEVYDPDTEIWTELSPQVHSRMYHSTAVLLPDARVLSAGQNDGPGQYTSEIYEPAYLFQGPRPTITSAPAVIGYSGQLIIQTPNASSISSVALIAPSTVTHSVNTTQRYVGLNFSMSSATQLTATMPPTGNHAPPGYYMLFIVNNQGVPSVAKWVQLANSGPVPATSTLGLLAMALVVLWVGTTVAGRRKAAQPR